MMRGGAMSRPRLTLASVGAVLVLAALLPVLAACATKQETSQAAAPATKRACIFPGGRVSTLSAVERLLGRRFNCVVAFNDAAPNWEGWEDPWFTHHPDPDLNWAKWARGRGRRLIVTQNLFPAELARTDWLTPGARGAFTGHARALARHLVAAGLGDSVIRLAHEANGDWYPYSVTTDRRKLALWRRFWRRTALAMRSVRGAHFRFDWCVNAAYRPIPLASFYPGDDVVDYVGIDAYDAGVPPGRPRWATIYNQRGGIRQVLAFARAHGKPLTIPEWGIGPANSRQLSGGDDPAYVNGIAGVVRRNRVGYQSYFYAHEWADQLLHSPNSLAAYRRHFG
jgi:hypothetical protein